MSGRKIDGIPASEWSEKWVFQQLPPEVPKVWKLEQIRRAMEGYLPEGVEAPSITTVRSAIRRLEAQQVIKVELVGRGQNTRWRIIRSANGSAPAVQPKTAVQPELLADPRPAGGYAHLPPDPTPAPDRIWLQWASGNKYDTTWSHDKIGKSDTEYIRADLVYAHLEELLTKTEGMTLDLRLILGKPAP